MEQFEKEDVEATFWLLNPQKVDCNSQSSINIISIYMLNNYIGIFNVITILISHQCNDYMQTLLPGTFVFGLRIPLANIPRRNQYQVFDKPTMVTSTSILHSTAPIMNINANPFMDSQMDALGPYTCTSFGLQVQFFISQYLVYHLFDKNW